MNRTCFVLLASLVGSFLFSADAQAGKKLYVGNLPVSPTDRFGVFDPSTTPPTEVQDLGIALQGAQTGTVQNPGNPLPASSSVAILNLDEAGEIGAAAACAVLIVAASTVVKTYQCPSAPTRTVGTGSLERQISRTRLRLSSLMTETASGPPVKAT